MKKYKVLENRHIPNLPELIEDQERTDLAEIADQLIDQKIIQEIKDSPKAKMSKQNNEVE